MDIEAMTLTDLTVVLAEHHRYWGERDLRALHQQVFVREFGDTCLVARAPHGGPADGDAADGAGADDAAGGGDAAGGILGYLIGFAKPDGTGYIHLVAVRDDACGGGVARTLYSAFAAAVARHGAVRLKAITSVANTGSIAFHTALGFDAVRVEDHAGPGQPRMVFSRPLPLTG